MIAKSEASSKSSQNKLKSAMEAISFLNNQVQHKDKEIKEMRREKKKTDYRLEIVEKEKTLMKQ